VRQGGGDQQQADSAVEGGVSREAEDAVFVAKRGPGVQDKKSKK